MKSSLWPSESWQILTFVALQLQGCQRHVIWSSSKLSCFFSPFFCATLCQVKKEFLKGKDWMRQYEFGFTALMCKDFLSTSSSHPLLSNLKCCVELCVDQAIKSAAEEALNHVMTNINQRAMLPRELVSFD